MTRACFAAVLVAVTFAPAASAEPTPTPIRHDRDISAIALAGPDVLALSEHDGGVRVIAVPRAGGSARTLLSVPAGRSFHVGDLAASAERVGVIVDVEGKTDEHRVYSGPPSGPLRLVRQTPDPDGNAWTPYIVSADGDRLLLVEGIPQYTDDGGDQESEPRARVQLLDDTGWTTIPWASGKRLPVAIAGPYAAVVASDPQRVELVDLATGALRSTVTGKWSERLELDLSADGRLALGTEAGIDVAPLGGPQSTVAGSAHLTSPAFAGTSLAAFDDARHTLDLFGADGAPQTLGPPSLVQTDLDADADGVAWLFNGCVRYAAFGAAAPAAGKDPCPASEVALYGIPPQGKLRGRSASTPVKCVASRTGRCRGHLIARSDYGKPIVGRGAFDLPVGDKWVKVPIHFDRPTVARLHRHASGSFVVNAKLRNGTVGTGADYGSELGVEVDGRS